MDTQLTTFEDDFATAAISIDTLFGGNYKEPTGEHHFLVDSWCSGKQEPRILLPGLQNYFLRKGVKANIPRAITKFLEANKVEERLERLHVYTDALTEKWRKSFLEHQLAVLEAALHTRKHMVSLGAPVSKEEAYAAAFGHAPRIIDAQKEREELRLALASVGLEVTQSATLADLVHRWTTERKMSVDALETDWKPAHKRMLEETRRRILPYLPRSAAEIPEENVDFSVIKKKVHYSGINLSHHTIVDDKPTYKTTIKISSEVEYPPEEYELGIVAHEARPGHDLHIPLAHAAYARGEYGFETTMMLLCTAFATLAEGIATSTTNLLHGMDLSGMNPHERIAIAKNDLGYAGRNNGVVEWMQRNLSKNALKELLRQDYCWSQKTADKYIEGWLFHPLLGTLLGVMYLPSYGLGRDVVKTAIHEYGREMVIPVVYGTQGQVDAISFPARMKEYAAQKNLQRDA